jgi:hypothetical protein
MKRSEVNALEYGLYIIFWKSGGNSLAAVGGMESGERWIAPCNWLHPASLPTIARISWKKVKRVVLVMK